MPDLAPLLARLTTLVAQPRFTETGARVIGGRGALPSLTAILREIDATVLSRTLVFELAESRVTLLAAQRRLRGLSSATKAGELEGKVLLPEDEEAISRLGTYLKGICAGDPVVTVRSLPAEDFGEQIDTGVTVAALARAWNIDIDVIVAPPVERFLAANANLIEAAIYCAPSGALREEGETGALKPLWEERMRPFREAHVAALPAGTAPMLVSLDDEGQSRLALATAGAEASLFRHAEGDLDALLKSWLTISQV